MAVRQLLLDGKLEEAKRDLGPIAFNPHENDDRDKAAQVLLAIEFSKCRQRRGVDRHPGD